MNYWFRKYLKEGFYPYYFENRRSYPIQVENVIDYIINTELTLQRGLETGNTRKVKALLKYLKDLEEAKLIVRLFQDLSSISDLQKPDKILLDNSNIIHVLSDTEPNIGTVRECFLANQLASTGHKVEYGGLSTGDFRIDGKYIIEVGGSDKGFKQLKNDDVGYVAADDIDSATFRKIPLWSFGFLY